jgi:hypothetical protein
LIGDNVLEHNINALSDDTFIKQFEDLSLSPDYFNHIGHLRIAWLYLHQNDLEQAINKVCTGINAYAISLGATEKFHLTITDSIVRIMAGRINVDKNQSWPMFLESNQDLVEDALAVLCEYFSRSLLLSELARLSLVKPDLKAI